MPSSSARCSQLPRAIDKVPFYEALRKFRDHLNGKLPDLQESEITFPDVALKTAVKKEPKEENSEVYPGESSNSQDSQLSQFSEGSYQFIPHQVPGTTCTSMPSVPLPSSFSDPCSLSSVSGQNGFVKVKQEPVDSDYHAKSSQSETMPLGQFEVYNQSGTSGQSDGHLNNFLNGLYGLVDQVADGKRFQSKYGMVSQAGISNGPVQFNDALRDIVKEGAEDFDMGSGGTEMPQEQVSSPPAEPAGKKAKATKPRKRKSKSKADLNEEQSPEGQHVSPPSHSSASSPQMSVPSCIQGSAMPPYTSNMQYSSFPVTSYDGMVYSNPPFTAQMPVHFPPSQTFSNTAMSYPGMIPSYPVPYMGMPPQNGMMPGYPYPMSAGNLPGDAQGMPGFHGLDPNVRVKQEKPDL